jgi:integration host factor subunit beta
VPGADPRPALQQQQRATRIVAMTRSDLVAKLAERFAQLTQRDTEFAVKTILDAMTDALARGHRIEIRGFGSFSINRRPPRVGRNPRSGEQVTIPEKLVPHFKPGKALRESVDQQLPATTQPGDLGSEKTRVGIPK